MTDVTVTAASDIEVDREQLDASISQFAEKNGTYYANAFHKIHESTGFLPNTFNLAAALLGPIWAAMRAKALDMTVDLDPLRQDVARLEVVLDEVLPALTARNGPAGVTYWRPRPGPHSMSEKLTSLGVRHTLPASTKIAA